MQLLVYSKYCKHCLQLINELEKVPQVGNCLEPLCVDPQLKQDGSYTVPENFIELQNYLKEKSVPQIVKVPSIILGNQNEIVVLSGSNAFNWVDNVSKQFVNQVDESSQENLQKNETVGHRELQLEGVNPNEMMSFSDSYSMLNSDSVSNQSYQFIDRQLQSIPTHEEQIIGNKEKFCQQKYEELLKEREQMK